eukprot:TRINITY_DN3198_c2_g5_i1.p1 TRINITY_DN3198_c2_g5~~TRINITY_DN3198_c2_g5_i1.p1  ORF type:complete len:160 (+),score=48.25 TRINITY_DN3198_c2_g5_i1:60-539(+)
MNNPHYNTNGQMKVLVGNWFEDRQASELYHEPEELDFKTSNKANFVHPETMDNRNILTKREKRLQKLEKKLQQQVAQDRPQIEEHSVEEEVFQLPQRQNSSENVDLSILSRPTNLHKADQISIYNSVNSTHFCGDRTDFRKNTAFTQPIDEYMKGPCKE